MKKYTLKLVLLSTLLFTGMAFINWGCKDPTEGVELAVSTDFLSSPSTFTFVDAVTGEDIAALEGKLVSITGPYAEHLYTEDGRKTFKITGGTINVLLRANIIPSLSNPVKFNIVFDNSGFMPIVYPVVLKGDEQLDIDIPIVDLNNLPGGTAQSSVSGSVGSTGVSANTNLILASTPTMLEAASVQLDSGTIVKDQNGNALTGGLGGTIIHFTASDSGAFNCFPGSLTDNEIKDKNGNTLPSQAIAPAGWLNMNMTCGGTAIKSFSKPVKAKIEIPDDLYNPETNASYKAGDQLDVLSKDELGENWVNEGTATLVLNSNNKLEASFDVTHLSTWILSKLTSQCGFTVSLGAYYSDVSLSGSVSYSAYSDNNSAKRKLLKSGSVKYKSTGYTFRGSSYVTSLPNIGYYEIKTGRTELKSKKFSNLGWDKKLISYYVANPIPKLACDGVTLDASSSSNKSTITGYFRARCLSGGIQYAVLPKGTVLYAIPYSVYIAYNKPGYSKKVNGVRLWEKLTLNWETKADKSVFNTLTLTKNPESGEFGVTAGELYVFSLVYNSQKVTYEYTAPNPLPDEITITMDVPTCK